MMRKDGKTSASPSLASQNAEGAQVPYGGSKADIAVAMIPHNESWSTMVVVVIMLHTQFNLFKVMYLRDTDESWSTFIHYVFEVCFLADAIFIIAHRNFSSHKLDLCTKKLPFILIVIAWITLIPYYEIYVYFLDGTNFVVVSTWCKLKVLLRLVHVQYYFFARSKEASNRTVFDIFFEFMYRFSFCFMSGACFWTMIGCLDCDEANWMDNLKNFIYDDQWTVDKFFYPYTFVAAVFIENYPGIIKPENWYEFAFLICLITLGIIIKSLVYARLIRAFICSQEKRHVFDSRLKNTFDYIQKEAIDKSLKDDIKHYYNTFWEKKSAIAKVPSYFKLLPLSLQKDVMVDIFWDAFKHSHVFRDIDRTFKRDLSLIMKTEFLLAGDYLYKTDELKSKMYYVVVGIVQILSNEDDESPVISFSSGTVFSEMSCFMPCKSDCMVRCASFCQFQTISISDLSRKLALYRHKTAEYRRTLNSRIKLAQMLNSRKVAHLKKDRPFIWIKTHWRAINANKVPKYLSSNHTNRYLDLYVLSDEMELKVQVICLTATFPFIFHPDSSFRKFCNYVCLVSVIVQCIVVPYCASFARAMGPTLRTFCLFLDYVYVFDLVMQMTTAIKYKETMITTFGGILMRRLKQYTFQADILATLPIDYFGFFKGVSDHTFVLLKVPRIIKVYKLIRLIQNQERIIGRDQILSKFIKHLVIYFILVYFGICLFYGIACFNEECYKHSWYEYNIIKSRSNLRDINPFTRTMMTVITLVNGAGDANNHAYTILDTIVSFVLSLLGYVLFTVAITDITAAQYWRLHDEYSHRILTRSMKLFGIRHKISDKIIFRVENMMTFRWNYSRDLIKRNAMKIFRDTPDNLRQQIQYSLITKYLESQPLFQELDERVIREITKISLVMAIPPKAYLSFNDRIVTHIYIIKRGYLSSESDVPGDKDKRTHRQLITVGACFPVVEAMHEISSFITVHAVTAVECIAIPYNRLIKYLKMDENGYRILKSSLEIHLKENFSVLTRAEHRLNLRAERGGLTENKLFQYSTRSQRARETLQGIRRLLKATVRPNSKFCSAAEIIRCTLAVIQFIVASLYLSVLYDLRLTFNVVNHFLDSTVWIDCLIRTRIHYYDEFGRLETRIKMISRHYLSTTFWVDLYSSLPVDWLSLGRLMSKSNHCQIATILYFITRPFQLFRVFSGMSYLFNRYKYISDANAVRIKCFFIIVTFVFIFANFIMLFTCRIGDYEITCPVEVMLNFVKKTADHHQLSLYLHSACKYLTRSENVLYIEDNVTYWAFATMSLFLLIFSWYIMSRLNSAGLSSEYMRIQIQNDRRSFKAFCKKETAEKGLVDNILQMHAYHTSVVNLYAMEQARLRLTAQLISDFSYSLYWGALGKACLLKEAPSSLKKYLSLQIRSEFVKKDAIIIRTNDVQENVYLIRHGNVHVVVANEVVAILTEGAMFGSFSRHGYVRHTIQARATLHTELLVMKSKIWRLNISKHPKITKMMNDLVKGNAEYVVSTTQGDTVSLKSIDTTRTTSSWRQSRGFLNIRRYWLINPSNKSYRIYNQFQEVHMSTFSCMLTLFYQLVSMFDHTLLHLTTIIYLFDAIFLFKIMFAFLTTYVDTKSGIIITDHRMIAERYLKTSFTLDLITVIPLELVVGFFSIEPFYLSLIFSNRILRIFFLMNYYYHCKKHNKLTHILRTFYCIYIFLFCEQVLTNVWSYIACYHSKGCLARTNLNHDNFVYAKSNSTLLSVLMCYHHVFNTISASGLLVTGPTNDIQVWLNIAMALISYYLLSMLIGSFALIEIIDNYSLAVFNYNVKELQTYLRHQNLSPSILNKVSNYCATIWKVQVGEQFPALLETTVPFLKQDIMYDIYGHHLLNNKIFRNTHRDFLRQLLVHLKRCSYPSNYVVVDEGDNDNTMYFIHAGVVNCVARGEHGGTNVLYKLGKNQVFGLEAGLIGTRHKYTYVVNSFADIVMLYKGDWGYLLEFFPASVEEILDRAREYGLFDMDKL